MTRILIPLIALCTLSTTAVARPGDTEPPDVGNDGEGEAVETVLEPDYDPVEINLLFGWRSANLPAHTFDYFSTNDWLVTGFIGAEVEALDSMFVQLLYEGGGQEGHIFGWKYPTSLRTDEVSLGVRQGYRLLSWLRPYAGLWGTATWVDTEVDAGANSALKQSSFLWGGRLAAGVEARIPRKAFHGPGKGKGLFKDFSFGMALEGGYILRQQVSMSAMSESIDADSDSDGAVDGMTSGKIDMGSLSMSGWFLAFSARAYF